jgi:hypothetical protein
LQNLIRFVSLWVLIDLSFFFMLSLSADQLELLNKTLTLTLFSHLAKPEDYAQEVGVPLDLIQNILSRTVNDISREAIDRLAPNLFRPTVKPHNAFLEAGVREYFRDGRELINLLNNNIYSIAEEQAYVQARHMVNAALWKPSPEAIANPIPVNQKIWVKLTENRGKEIAYTITPCPKIEYDSFEGDFNVQTLNGCQLSLLYSQKDVRWGFYDLT